MPPTLPLRRKWLSLEALERRELLAADMALEFSIQGQEADSPPGVELTPQMSVAGTYALTNTGDESLTGPVVVDDAGTPGLASDDITAAPVLAAALARGTLERSHANLRIAHLVQHPTLPYLYGSVWATDAIAVLNTDTLDLELVPTGDEPRGIALSNDGTRLYVANFGSQSVGVMDVASRSMLSSLPMPEKPWDIEVGAEDQLIVAGTRYIRQFNATSGAEIGTFIGGTHGGELEISPQKDRLYYGDFGVSPATMVQIDMTTNPPTEIWRGSGGAGNGQDLALSPDGQFISYAAGSGQALYKIAKFRTSDMSIVGMFNTGAYPREAAYSPDNEVVYTSNGGRQIKVWDANTFLQDGSIDLPQDFEPAEMLVDRSGARLFVATHSDLRVYSTGRGSRYNIGDADGDNRFDPGETWQFASSTTPELGLHARSATATAETDAQQVLTRTDPAHYYVPEWQATLTARVAGQPAAASPGPALEAGATVEWTYEITNSGLVPLAQVALVDNAGTPPTADDVFPVYGGGDVDGDALLDPGETWLYQLTATALVGQRQHVGMLSAQPTDASGTPLAGVPPLERSVETFYFGAQATMAVSATINGQAASAAPGPAFALHEALVWDYEVANTGNVPLSAPVVTGAGGIATQQLTTPVAPGTLERQHLNHTIHHFLEHPTRPLMYATDIAHNAIVVINTETLEIEAQVFIGSEPRGMALSNDGGKLYVALATSHFIGVLDTTTNTTLPPLEISEKPLDIEVGADGRLFVAGERYVMQLSPETGAPVGPFIGGTYSGELAISPQQDRLYYGDFGLSPATLVQWDLTTEPPSVIWVGSHDASNGQDVNLTHDGQFISYAAGSGQDLYKIAKFRTSDMAVVGMFPTGAYPREITYSPDNSLAFTVNNDGQIRIWNANTFLEIGQIPLPGTGTFEMRTDRAGGRLYVSTHNDLRIFSTGLASTFNVGDANRNGLFDPGETWRYSGSLVAGSGGQHEQAITVTADNPLGSGASAAVSTFYRVTGWSVALEAAVEGSDADTAPGAAVNVDQDLAWTLSATNPGEFALADVVVTDDNGTPDVTGDDRSLELIDGDTNTNGWLDPGESWQYAFSSTAGNGPHQHQARVTATPVDLNGQPLAGVGTISASDPTWYFGKHAALQVVASVNGHPADAPPGPEASLGEMLTFTYQVRNTGEISLSGVQLVDDNSTPGGSDDFRPIHVPAPFRPRGALERTFNIGVTDFVLHPTLPYLYASVHSQNAIAIINVDTLTLETQLFVGSGPRGLALSADGSRLYVATSLSQFLAVVDTESRTALPSLQLTERPQDVEVGADGRLYVLTESRIRQLDPETGAVVGPEFGGVSHGGKLVISPQKDRLYEGNYGISPATLRQFDLTTDPPALLRTVHDDAANGQDLAMTADGQFVSYAAGYGQGGYRIARYRTSDMTIVGHYETGAYPREVTYSQDGAIAYTVSADGRVDTWDAATFARLGTISTPAEHTVAEMIVDPSDRYLFASSGGQLLVYSTGRGDNPNVGDFNRNRLLDPGETWFYAAQRSAKAGQQAHLATASGSAPSGASISSSDLAHYSGVPILQVIEDAGGRNLTAVSEPGVILIVSDQRFEVVDGQLRLKVGESLSAPLDDGTVLEIRTPGGSPVVVKKFILEVTSNPLPWHNDVAPLDVDGDGAIAPLDALLIIIQLNSSGPRTLAAQLILNEPSFYDVDGDGVLAPLDALLVIIHLNIDNSPQGEAPAMPAAPAAPAASDAVWADFEASAAYEPEIAYLHWLALEEVGRQEDREAALS